jgi:AcrR family transcriptional regulator
VNTQAIKTIRGPYRSGIIRRKAIIEAAISLLIEEGYHSFSFRKVAKKVGISVGNLQHHFSTKEELVKSMLDTVITRYLSDFEELEKTSSSPQQQLHNILQHVITDLTTKKTTLFFPELWSLANHSAHVSRSMDDMYERYRAVLKKTISKINPRLSSNQIEKLALFMSASLEGHTIFIGHNKRWSHLAEDIVEMAYQSFLHLIETEPITD